MHLLNCNFVVISYYAFFNLKEPKKFIIIKCFNLCKSSKFSRKKAEITELITKVKFSYINKGCLCTCFIVLLSLKKVAKSSKAPSLYSTDNSLHLTSSVCLTTIFGAWRWYANLQKKKIDYFEKNLQHKSN